MRHDNWLVTAYRMATKSKYDRYKMVAIVVKSGRIISVGFNKPRIGGVKDSRYYIKHIHAELDAILKLPREEIRGAEIYVSGICIPKTYDPLDAPRRILSKPCEVCQEFLKDYALKGIYYHDQDGSTLSLVS